VAREKDFLFCSGDLDFNCLRGGGRFGFERQNDTHGRKANGSENVFVRLLFHRTKRENNDFLASSYRSSALAMLF
jgi:hypothetical protein